MPYTPKNMYSDYSLSIRFACGLQTFELTSLGQAGTPNERLNVSSLVRSKAKLSFILFLKLRRNLRVFLYVLILYLMR